MTTTVQQLIEKLQGFPPEAEIILEDEPGDEYYLGSVSARGFKNVVMIKLGAVIEEETDDDDEE
ncbi:hypothetical protein NIES25_51810 [Nostoc linckia NIES-25]|nr:hypothetical protein NIES25_51530 [Nostoc linckia NIES-25]BAY78705.1 hypothetical protein NIES25_51810 [Nostoc linckia NIES-25]